MTIKEINNIFDIQIAKGQDEIHKQLFNLTKDFTIADWRKIRDKDYWEEVKLMNSIQRKEITLQRVIKYINTPSY